MIMKEQSKKYIYPAFMIIMLLIIIAGYMIIYNNRQSYASEIWVYDCLKAYSSGNLTELDIQVLSKNLSNQIDKKIADVDMEADLTDEQLMELMAMVNSELQYADYSIPQEELSRLSASIVNQMISKYTNLTAEKNQEYEAKIIMLEGQLSELRQSLQKADSNYANITNLMNETGLNEETVKGWLNELSDVVNTDKEYYEAVLSEVADLLEMDKNTLKEIITHAAETDNQLEYLAKKLGITEEKLNEKLSQTDVSDGKGLFELADRLKSIQDNLQDQINNRYSLVNSNISAVQSQVTNNKKAAESALADNKTELTDKITSNKEETDKKINENKAYTDTAIEELQTNVLFYEYDSDTNTVRLFEKPEGDNDHEE